MRFLKSVIVLTFVFSTVISPLRAENIPESAKAPAEAMAKLSGMLGEWTVVTEMINPEGDWIEQGVDRVSVKAGLEGLMIAETHQGRVSGESLIVETDYSFDQYRNVYRAAALDNTWGLMDIYEGDLSDGALVLTNLRAGTSFVLDDGRDLNFRLTIPVSGDERVMTVDQSIDAGASWTPFFRLTYKRAAAE